MTTKNPKQETARVLSWLRESSTAGPTEHELATVSMRKTRSLRPISSPDLDRCVAEVHLDAQVPPQLSPQGKDAFAASDDELSATQPMLPTLPSAPSEAGAIRAPASFSGLQDIRQASALEETTPDEAEGMRCGMLLCERYLLEAYLGTTPTGELYQVFDQRQKRRYFCKVYPLSRRRDKAYMRSFVKAFRQQERINHPNILQACGLEYDPVLRVPIALFSWVEGESLLSMLSKHRGATPLLPPKALRSVLSQLCSALAYLDATGVPFVGLHPRLVRLYQQDGKWRLRLLQVAWVGVETDTETVECPKISSGAQGEQKRRKSLYSIDPFLAPELMYREQPATTASTVYALGVLCFRLMLGDQPLALDRREAPGEGSQDEQIKRILLRATQPDKRRRFGSIGAFWQRLSEVLGEA